jgi:hypothetical protein
MVLGVKANRFAVISMTRGAASAVINREPLNVRTNRIANSK